MTILFLKKLELKAILDFYIFRAILILKIKITVVIYLIFRKILLMLNKKKNQTPEHKQLIIITKNKTKKNIFLAETFGTGVNLKSKLSFLIFYYKKKNLLK